MGDQILVWLYEFGDWLKHWLPREVAKPTVRDMVKQLSDEPIRWLITEMPLHQLDELAEAVRVEKRERERSQNQPPEIRDALKLL